jgi:hypothetical protein
LLEAAIAAHSGQHGRALQLDQAVLNRLDTKVPRNQIALCIHHQLKTARQGRDVERYP